MVKLKVRYTFDDAYWILTRNLSVANSNSLSGENSVMLAKTLSRLPREIAEWAIIKLIFLFLHLKTNLPFRYLEAS